MKKTLLIIGILCVAALPFIVRFVNSQNVEELVAKQQETYQNTQRPPKLDFSPVRIEAQKAFDNEITSDDIVAIKLCRKTDGTIDTTIFPKNNDFDANSATHGFRFTDPKGLKMVRENMTDIPVKDVMVYDLTPLYGSEITAPGIFLQIVPSLISSETADGWSNQPIQLLENQCVSFASSSYQPEAK